MDTIEEQGGFMFQDNLFMGATSGSLWGTTEIDFPFHIWPFPFGFLFH